MSLVLRPQVQAERAPGLALVVALAVCDACARVGVQAGIKWPNDVVADGKKLCGILLEMAADADGVEWVVAGAGINVCQRAVDFPPELRETAASLEMISGQTQARVPVLIAYLTAFEEHYVRWLSAEGLTALLPALAARSVTLGRPVRVQTPQEGYLAMAERIDETGALLVRREDGTISRVLAADVSVRGVMGYVD